MSEALKNFFIFNFKLIFLAFGLDTNQTWLSILLEFNDNDVGMPSR